jgi:hypothetical protein
MIERLPYITVEVVRWQLVRNDKPTGPVRYADTVEEAKAAARTAINNRPGQWQIRFK